MMSLFLLRIITGKKICKKNILTPASFKSFITRISWYKSRHFISVPLGKKIF